MITSPRQSRENDWIQKRRNISKYDALSPIYEEIYRDEQLKKYQAVISNLQKRRRRVCLEMGCGTGIGLEASSEIYGEVWVGIDLSRGMLEEAKKRILGGERRHLVLADSDFTPLRSACADLVICVTLISNTPNPMRTLREMGRVAVSGGEIAVTVLRKGSSSEDFQELIQESGLKIRKIVDKRDIKDYVFLCSRS